MKTGLVAGTYLQADETPIRYLDPDVKGKSQQGWLWTYSHPQGDVVFEWHISISRSREGPRQFLKEFKGKLQTDGYGVYESLARERGGELILIGCWAHARRGFHEALEEVPCGGLDRRPDRAALCGGESLAAEHRRDRTAGGRCVPGKVVRYWCCLRWRVEVIR